ncbi:MAG: DUF3365 domain-containing protein [Chloroflexota bacterium]
MISRLKLSTKFTLMLTIVLIVGIAISGLILWQVLQNQAQAEIRSKAFLLIDTMNATRQYTSQHVRPLLVDDLETEATFISETVPAYSAREVFERFRQKEGQSSFFYKEATLNPTNPRDQADAFETDLVSQMKRDLSLAELSGFRQVEGEDLFYIARPLTIESESCLACHSTPDVAPISLVNTFGDQGGFGWELNEIVAAQIIYVPAQEVYTTAVRAFILMMSIFALIFAFTIVLLNFLLRRYVIQPIGVMGHLAQRMSTDEMQADDLETETLTTVTRRDDELGQLAQVFRRMASEVLTRTQNLKQQVQQLRIEIDQFKRTKEVNEIVETDFFKDLQSKADAMRREHQNRRGNKPVG